MYRTRTLSSDSKCLVFYILSSVFSCSSNNIGLFKKLTYQTISVLGIQVFGKERQVVFHCLEMKILNVLVIPNTFPRDVSM